MSRKLTPGLRERSEVESWSSSDFTHAVWVMAVSAKKRRYDSKDVIFGGGILLHRVIHHALP